MLLLLRWILNALALALVSQIVPGISFSSTWSLLVTILILGLVNAFVRPIILLLTLPVSVLTLGLFTLVINGLMFWLASSMVKGFEVSNFSAAFFGALVYWIITMIIGLIEKK